MKKLMGKFRSKKYAVLIAILICFGFYKEENVMNDMTDSVTSWSKNYASNYIGTASTAGSKFTDLQIYPEEFQRLKRQQTKQRLGRSEDQNEMRHRFRRHNRESLYSLMIPEDVNATSTNLSWARFFDYLHEHIRKRHRQGFYETHDVYYEYGFETDDERIAYRENPERLRAAWGKISENQKPRLIVEQNLCKALKNAKEIANFQTPHVLLTHTNENWGALSSEVPNRTAMWGDIVKGNNYASCDLAELKELYLDSPNTLAIFTVQHQAIYDHPKVHSLPLGISRYTSEAERLAKMLQLQKKSYNASTVDDSDDPRPILLMINANAGPARALQFDAVIKKFADAGMELSNSYGKKFQEYIDELNTHKFILSPAGIGWDCYRIWEAITMGIIPVIERHKYRYEVVTYPPDSGKRLKFIRTLKKDETGADLKATRATQQGKKLAKFLTNNALQRHNASLAVVEYYDGWRRSLDDLPVVWIDAEFGDVAPENNDDGKRYLTPEVLEREYDAMAARVDTFRYEKMSSLYWLRLIESFLLLEDPNKAFESIDGPLSFSSPSEERTWRLAMETLTSTYTNHTMLSRPKKECQTYHSQEKEGCWDFSWTISDPLSGLVADQQGKNGNSNKGTADNNFAGKPSLAVLDPLSELVIDEQSKYNNSNEGTVNNHFAGKPSLADATKTLLNIHPDRLKICNLATLDFDETKMIGNIDLSYRIFDHSSKLAYGPQITKTGSTSSKKAQKYMLNVTDNDILKPDNWGPFDQYNFYTFIRNPVERFLAGFHQIEVFWRMNWFSSNIDKFELQWWNQSCGAKGNSSYEVLDKKHLCTGSEPQLNVAVRIGRLNAFLDDIARVGYFDQHIMPITYQFFSNPLFQEKSQDLHPSIFDVHSMDELGDSLSAVIRGHKLSQREKFRYVERNKIVGMDDAMPWVMSWKELKKVASEKDNNAEARLAKAVIEKICILYEHDVRCLPYDIPECKITIPY